MEFENRTKVCRGITRMCLNFAQKGDKSSADSAQNEL